MSLTHGGDIEGFRIEYGHEPIDFSSNCNPLGMPPSAQQAIADAVPRAVDYPDPLCRRLCDAIAAHEGVKASQVLCGNGAADLIFRLAIASLPQAALLTAPTFSEYGTALDLVGCDVSYHVLSPENGFSVDESILESIHDVDMVFICNPNNPTGHTVEPQLMERILARCEEEGALLFVDECFHGFLDDPEAHTMRGMIGEHKSLFILDAFTKLYGMAGVRLGYCLCSDEELLDAMRESGQPWAVSSLAQAAGIASLGEDDFVVRSRTLVAEERAFLADGLSDLGLQVLGGEADYLFLRSDDTGLCEKMREHGVLIRDCGNYVGLQAGYYRVAVKLHEHNVELLDAFGDVLAR